MAIGNKNQRANAAWRAEHPDEIMPPDDPQTDDPESFEVYYDPTTKKKDPPPAAGPAPAITLTMEDLQSLITSAVHAAVGAQSAQNTAISDAIGHSLKQARQPIPENTDADNPRISAYNPFGERDHPRPGLKCEFFWGVRDNQGKTLTTPLEFISANCSAREQVALNTLEPLHGEIRTHHGERVPVTIEPARRDAVTGAIQRLLVVVPYAILEKGSQKLNDFPDIVNMVRQLTGRDFRKREDGGHLTDADLQWLMAEHCAKRYVADLTAA